MQTGFFAAVRRVVAPVRRRGGEVHRRRGDGAVRRAGGHRDRRAALRAGRAGPAAGARPVRPGGPRPATGRFRVGVATGEALVDVGAARDGGQAIVAGDVVNTAARLQSVAPPGGVLVCGATHAADQDEIRYARTAGGDPARPVHADRGVAGARRRCSASTPTASPTRRRWSTATTSWACSSTRCTASLRDRMPRLVTVLGRAGIGKSRLVRELYQHARPAHRPAGDLAHRPVPAVRRERRVRRARRHRARPRPGILDTDTRRPPRRSGSTPRCADLVAGRPRRPGSPTRCARWSACPARQAVHRGGRVGLAAVPARAGRPPARPCSSSRTCTGPTTRCCASSSCSARPRGTCRCCWCAPPGRS